MRHDIIEKLYDTIDEMAMLLVEHANLRYLDGLTAASANIMAADVLQEVDTEIEIKLFALSKELNEMAFNSEEVRKALQLALLKGLKSDNLSLDGMTPDGVAVLMGYLVDKLKPEAKGLKIADFVVGTGNLLTAILNTLKETPEAIYGVDSDYKMLELAKMMVDMQNYEAQFYQQSSTRDMNVPLVDVIVGDLPAKGVEEKAHEGSALGVAGCHDLPYLLVENHLDYLSEDGYAIYVIGNGFFSQEHASLLHEVITKKASICMLLQLPTTLFKGDREGKSLLVLRKRKMESEALVAVLPDFNNTEKVQTTLTKVEDWIKLNI